MEIVPVPTCCKLHAHNYTCIPKMLGRRGTVDPTGQLLVSYWSATGQLVIIIIIQGRSGEIRHLYRSFAFLHSRLMTDNGGIFVCRTRNLVLAGGNRVSYIIQINQKNTKYIVSSVLFHKWGNKIWKFSAIGNFPFNLCMFDLIVYKWMLLEKDFIYFLLHQLKVRYIHKLVFIS